VESVVTAERASGPDWPSQEDSEPRLTARLRQGDRQAAERLVELTYRSTYGALLRLTGDAETAAELTQETYRKAWAALPSFRGGARFSTWLYRIAYTTFLNSLRRPRLLVPLEEGTLEALPDPGVPADETLGASGQRDRLRQAVLALPEDLRFAVSAHYWGEVPIRDLARQQGVSTVALRKRLKRALALLAAALEDVS
jgi:RNA polymerase sigma-70 factor (ECF subfamily)